MLKFKSGIIQFASLLVLFGIFSLAGIPGECQVNKPFRFVVYGDTRGGHKVHKNICDAIVKATPAFVIHTGDLVDNSADIGQWRMFDEITTEMRSKFPFYPSRGNHDVRGKEYEARVTAPGTTGGKLYYSFNHGNSHFIALAVDEVSVYKEKSKQYVWFENDLKEARKKAAHIFVFFHVPPYSIGSHGSDFDVREQLEPLFVRYGVRAVFNGHDHIYYRTIRNGIPFIVSGGGGAPLYYPDPKKGAIEGDKWERVNHYCVIEVKGESVVSTAYRPDGTVIESLKIK